MEQIPPVIDDPDDLGPTWDELFDMIMGAIKDGVTAAEPGPVPLGEHVVLAAGVVDGSAAVIMLRRDPDDDLCLLYDTYLLSQDDAGQWRSPDASSGSAFPEWVLHRPERGADHRQWQESELVLMAREWAVLGGAWVTNLTVMASRRVAEVGITYGRNEFRRPVPPNGVLTVPARAGAVGQIARFIAYDHAGAIIGAAQDQPVDSDIQQWLNGIHPPDSVMPVQ